MLKSFIFYKFLFKFVLGILFKNLKIFNLQYINIYDKFWFHLFEKKKNIKTQYLKRTIFWANDYLINKPYTWNTNFMIIILVK